MDEWKAMYTKAMQIMTKDLTSMDVTEHLVKPLVKDYQILVGFGIFIGRLANKLLSTAMNTLSMMEDK